MSQILSGLDGVLCHTEDGLILRTTLAEHEVFLEATLSQFSTAGEIHNAKKCGFCQDVQIMLVEYLLWFRIGFALNWLPYSKVQCTFTCVYYMYVLKPVTSELVCKLK